MLKYNKALVCIVLFIGINAVHAQKEDLYLYYDSLTYSQYLNKEWHNLSRSTSKALHNDLDYYYLRMRAGIARYERQNYLMAERHFKKAAKQNELDPISREYIYYAKLFSGKEKDASLYFKRNHELLKNRVNSKNKAVRDLYIDLAYHFNFENDIRSHFQSEDFTGITGNQIVTRNFFFGSFLISHDISRYLTFTHGGSLLRKYNYYYSTSPSLTLDSYDHKINQNQYYASLSLHPGLDFRLNGSVHYVNLVSPEIIYRQRGYGTQYTIPGFHENYFLSRMSIQKYIHLFQIGAGISSSNLNNRNQLQKDASLIFFPLGNLNLYTISNYYHVRETDGGSTKRYPAIHQEIGFKLAKKLWVEAGTWQGQMKNIATNEGFVIYNGNEIITSRYDISFIVPENKFTFSLNGSLLNYYSTFTDSNAMETSLNKLHFNGLTLIAEIKWKF